MAQTPRPQPDLAFERKHYSAGRKCVGVDEVGRGCLAGPVVTAAVVLPEFVFEDSQKTEPWWLGLNDSKLLKPLERERLAALVWKHADVQVAWCTVEEVDRWNILHAAMIAMRRALWPFRGHAQAVLVDGNQSPFDTRFRCPQGEQEALGFTEVETLVKGDQRALSIAAASVVAKVYRDRWMSDLAETFPAYGFEEHKGYSTPAHYKALREHGPCVLHRRSFAPVREIFECRKTHPSQAPEQLTLV
ncbi:MAG: ribonuclease HII [Bdellovibrionota bacterium]